MKLRNLSIVLTLATLIACNSNEDATKIDANIIHSTTGEKPEVTFDVVRVEFGVMQLGDKISKQFSFTNTGDAPLIISRVFGECGCTVAEDWPKDPIAPGEKGTFTVTFDSKGKEGQIVKRIKVEANTNPSISVCALAGFVQTELNK